ncbi:MAG: histidine phosphatase family protein [Actinomycetota bacterium]
MSSTLVHLVRHAEVENPDNIWYGRLEGWVLSERGLRQAEALGKHFADRPISAIYSSPLIRALQTSEPIAKRHGLEVLTDEDVLESIAHLQGSHGDRRLFRNPLNARYFLNPYRPTWGEPYRSIRARMQRAVYRVRDAHREGEPIIVSHMTPVLVARILIEGSTKPPWRAKRPCDKASVTTLEFEDDRYLRTIYDPVGSAIL